MIHVLPENSMWSDRFISCVVVFAEMLPFFWIWKTLIVMWYVLYSAEVIAFVPFLMIFQNNIVTPLEMG